MANIFIVGFYPYNGSASHKLGYRNEEKAREAHKQALEDVPQGAITFLDDFGNEVTVRPSECVVVFNSSNINMQFYAALKAGEEEAARALGIPMQGSAP